jgi:hypothetical protein
VKARGPAVAILAGIVSAACAVDLAGRSMARASWMARIGIDVSAQWVVLLALVATALMLGGLAARRQLTPNRAVLAALAFAFAAGMAAQLHLGARLQSDGFYYFAYLRSIWFDRDLNFHNDYRLLGLDDKPHLFTPTPTGHAQTAWAIGPSLMAMPFFAVGDRIARAKAASGEAIAVDGTSYPYRQAVCVSGLVWGLVGLYFSFLLARTVATGGGAAASVALVTLGSFVLWYLVKEPSMAHAPSLAVVAAFTAYWARTRPDRTTRQWIVLGLLAGFMGAVRWQNVLFAVLPALDWTENALRLPRNRDALKQVLTPAVAFGLAAIVGLSPQLLAWKMIYGSWFAVSPISPEIRWWDSHWAEALWSSRNGLLAMSPVLYVGLAGLTLLWRRDRMAATGIWIALAAMTFLNGAVADWWGGAAFGGRRFDSTIPVFIAGAALALDAAVGWVTRHPRVVVGLGATALVVWNLTLMETATSGRLELEAPNEFGDVAARQASTLHRWIGHPFSYPATLLFALRNGVTPAEADTLWPTRFLGDPARPYGRIDIGGDDELAIGAGWYGVEREGTSTYRWAGREAFVRLALDHAAPLRVQIRAKAFSWPGAAGQAVTLDVNGHIQPPMTLANDWQTVEQVVPQEHWRAGVNRVSLTFAEARRPSDVGVSGDRRELAAAVDFVRVSVVQ